MSDRTAYQAAADLLRRKIADLDDGLHSIKLQGDAITKLRADLERSEKKLAEDKRARRELEQALSILEAGER